MTDNLDFTQPLALRRDPYTRFEGPFIGPDDGGNFFAIRDGVLISWDAGGCRFSGANGDRDLIPLQERPPVRKWPQGWAMWHEGHRYWRGIWSTERDARHSAVPATCSPILMIERTAADMLAEALRTVKATSSSGTSNYRVATDALKAWEDGL